MTAPIGAGLGALVALAALLLLSWARDRRPRPLVDRLAPFVQVPGLVSRRPLDPTITIATLRRRAADASSRADRDLPSRLARAGRGGAAGAYRVERLGWAATGGLTGAAVTALTGAATLSAFVLLPTMGAVAGWGACDLRLRRQERHRCATVVRQLPTLADLVALAVSAGATPLAAIERSGATIGGPLGEDVEYGIRLVHGGASAESGLRHIAAVSGVPALDRFVDSLVVALQRGTPVAEVARAQAGDIRAAERRRLMESAGRKDVSMLIPIVFLVLPAVVVIALLPGVQALHLVVP